MHWILQLQAIGIAEVWELFSCCEGPKQEVRIRNVMCKKLTRIFFSQEVKVGYIVVKHNYGGYTPQHM